MKKNINIIQIKGIRGLLLAGFVVCCLTAGFIVFPGWILMLAWNYASTFTLNIPAIGLIQGILLWGIVLVSYFIFRKEKVVVCVQAPQGLNDEELKAVFADINKKAKEDPILQAMIKAREAELAYKKQQENNNETETTTNIDSTKI